VRQFLTHHVTWSVNSVCHTFGKRAFATNDRSRNEWIVGLLGFGEGWHNNHHAFPRSAFHGLHWWQFDFAGYVIRGLERLRLVHDVYRIPPALQAERAHRLAHRRDALVTGYIMPDSPTGA
jgi:stearoyl-CoA desaturase (Delta-9 desaturase)